MDLYDTISEISKGGEKATFKTVAEVKTKKEKVKNEAAAKIQGLFKRASKKYFLLDVIMYRGPDEDEIKSKTKFTAVKQKIIKKYGQVFIQYAIVQLSVKAPKTFPPNLLDKLIARDHSSEEFKKLIEIMMTNEDFKKEFKAEQHMYLTAVWVLKATPTDNASFHYDPVETKFKTHKK